MRKLGCALVVVLLLVVQAQAAISGYFYAEGMAYDYRGTQGGIPYTGYLVIRTKSYHTTNPGVPEYHEWVRWCENGQYHLIVHFKNLEHATQLEFEVQDEPGVYYTSGGGFAFWAIYNGMTVNNKTFTDVELVDFNN